MEASSPRTPQRSEPRRGDAQRAWLLAQRPPVEGRELTDWRVRSLDNKRNAIVGAAVAGFVIGGGMAATFGLFRRSASSRIRGARRLPWWSRARVRSRRSSWSQSGSLWCCTWPTRSVDRQDGLHRRVPGGGAGTRGRVPPAPRAHPARLSILLVYLAILGGIFGLGLLVVPPIVSGVNEFVKAVPGYVTRPAQEQDGAASTTTSTTSRQAQHGGEEAPQHLGDAASALTAVTVGVFATLFQLVTVLALTFFLLKDGKKMIDWGLRQLEPGARRALPGGTRGHVQRGGRIRGRQPR